MRPQVLAVLVVILAGIHASAQSLSGGKGDLRVSATWNTPAAVVELRVKDASGNRLGVDSDTQTHRQGPGDPLWSKDAESVTGYFRNGPEDPRRHCGPRTRYSIKVGRARHRRRTESKIPPDESLRREATCASTS